MIAKGILIPIGGNEDKGLEQSESYSVDFVEDSILSHVVKEAGGAGANIVIIPTASSIQKKFLGITKKHLASWDVLIFTFLISEIGYKARLKKL